MKRWPYCLLVAGILLSGTAQAHGFGPYGHGYNRTSVGFYFGMPGPYYPYPSYAYPSYPYPYYAYPPVVIAPAQPTVYVEQQPQVIEQAPAPQQLSPAEEAGNYWYYCSNPDGYYPYVKNCSIAWKKVPATPPK
ncbi:MAG: hypothetical protein ACO29L_00430 [Candidatus Methylopumilus sp.]